MKAFDQNLSLNCLKNHVGEFWLDAFICILISKSVGELSQKYMLCSVNFGLMPSCVLYYQNLSVNSLINHVGEFWSDAFNCILISKSVGELSQKSCW